MLVLRWFTFKQDIYTRNKIQRDMVLKSTHVYVCVWSGQRIYENKYSECVQMSTHMYAARDSKRVSLFVRVRELNVCVRVRVHVWHCGTACKLYKENSLRTYYTSTNALHYIHTYIHASVRNWITKAESRPRSIHPLSWRTHTASPRTYIHTYIHTHTYVHTYIHINVCVA